MSTFSGVIVPMVTPFRRDEGQTINYEAGEQLVERIIAGGASGIFTFGSNGEFHVCTPDEKIREFSKFVIERVAGRVPVYVGTGSCSTREAVEMSKRAEDAGASAVSVINPYFMKVSDAEIEGYYEAVAESVRFPCSCTTFPSPRAQPLARGRGARRRDRQRQGREGLSGNMDNLAAYVEAAEGKDVDVLVGSDGKISAAHALGASGAIAGTANLITNVVVSLWRAPLEEGDAEAAASYHQADVEPIRDVLHMGSTPQTLKRALELAGVPVGPARRPVAETTPGVDEKVRAMLDHYGIAHE